VVVAVKPESIATPDAPFVPTLLSSGVLERPVHLEAQISIDALAGELPLLTTMLPVPAMAAVMGRKYNSAFGAVPPVAEAGRVMVLPFHFTVTL
jgi:hypothetical protein